MFEFIDTVFIRIADFFLGLPPDMMLLWTITMIIFVVIMFVLYGLNQRHTDKKVASVTVASNKTIKDVQTDVDKKLGVLIKEISITVCNETKNLKTDLTTRFDKLAQVVTQVYNEIGTALYDIRDNLKKNPGVIIADVEKIKKELVALFNVRDEEMVKELRKIDEEIKQVLAVPDRVLDAIHKHLSDEDKITSLPNVVVSAPPTEQLLAAREDDLKKIGFELDAAEGTYWKENITIRTDEILSYDEDGWKKFLKSTREMLETP